MENIFKRSWSFIVFTVFLGMANAQNPPQQGDNILTPELDKFIGEWRWVSGQDTVEISLKKENIADPFGIGYHFDALIGFHRYKKGNTVVESSYEHRNTQYADKKSTIIGIGESGMSNSMTMRMEDITKNKGLDMTVTISANHNTLTWELSNSEGLRVGSYDWGFTLPTQLTLTKVP